MPEQTSISSKPVIPSAPPATQAQTKPEVDTKKMFAAIKWSDVEASLKKVEDFYKSYAGKVGCNPFYYLHLRVTPLRERLSVKDTTVFKSEADKINEMLSLVADINALECNEKLAMHDPIAFKQEEERQVALKARRALGPQTIVSA